MIKKIIDTYRRDGFVSVIEKSYNRLIAIKKQMNIDLIKEEKTWGQLKDKYKGERVFVVGNGPSLNKTPLYLLKNEYKMCFNRFAVMQERLNWTPDFFLTSDNLVLNDLIADLDDIIPNTTYSFFPGIHFRGDNFIRSLSKYDNAYFTIQQMGKGFSEELPKIYPGGTVIYEGFQILKYLGFNEVYLIGVDMNYQLHNTVRKLSTKGIDIESQHDDDPNHFDPRYFGKNKKYHQPEKYVIDNIIKDLDSVSKKYISNEFKIINIGYDSCLKSFPIISFDKVLSFSCEEKERLFLELITEIFMREKKNQQDLSQFRKINNIEKFSPELDIFKCDIDLGLVLIGKAIFTHLPVGPYKNQYYFIKR